VRVVPRDGVDDCDDRPCSQPTMGSGGKKRVTMYGLSFIACLFWASLTLRFASAMRLPTSSAKCAEAAEEPGLGVCAGAGVREAGDARPVFEPERIAASFAEISARFCAIRASFCVRTRIRKVALPHKREGTGTYIGEIIWPIRGSLGVERL